MTHTIPTAVGALGVLTLTLTGCAPLDADTRISVTQTETRCELSATEIPAGKDRWTARNEIDELTRQQVLKILDDAGAEPASTLAYTVGTLLMMAPGDQRHLVAETAAACEGLADAEAANKLALEDLEGGADGLQIVFAGSQGAYGAGLTSDSDATIAHLLAGVRLDYGIPVTVEASPRAPNATAAIMRYVDSQHIDPSLTRISFGLDPLGAFALHGLMSAPWRETAPRIAADRKSVV